MKTPEEIKKGQECCASGSCRGCPYHREEHCVTKKNDDVKTYIHHLEAGIEHAEKVAIEVAKSIVKNVNKLKSRLAQAERERDACIKDIQQCQGAICNSCKHHYRPKPEIRHYACAILGEFDTFLEDGEGKPFVCGRFEWRGVCEENTHDQHSL